MKIIGLIGGMSWESSAVYYELLNRGVRERLGGSASARCLLYSFNFAEVERLQRAGDWERLRAMMFDAGRSLKAAGAELLVLCTNTMHKVMDGVEEALGLPFVHIVDATAAAIRAADFRRPALLGTRYTMEGGFYADRLRERFGLEALIPEGGDRTEINRVIFEELVRGVVSPVSRANYLAALDRLAARGADCAILGCTEIGLLIREHPSLPLFDSTELHARAALDVSLA